MDFYLSVNSSEIYSAWFCGLPPWLQFESRLDESNIKVKNNVLAVFGIFHSWRTQMICNICKIVFTCLIPMEVHTLGMSGIHLGLSSDIQNRISLHRILFFSAADSISTGLCLQKPQLLQWCRVSTSCHFVTWKIIDKLCYCQLFSNHEHVKLHDAVARIWHDGQSNQSMVTCWRSWWPIIDVCICHILAYLWSSHLSGSSWWMTMSLLTCSIFDTVL